MLGAFGACVTLVVAVCIFDCIIRFIFSERFVYIVMLDALLTEQRKREKRIKELEHERSEVENDRFLNRKSRQKISDNIGGEISEHQLELERNKYAVEDLKDAFDDIFDDGK